MVGVPLEADHQRAPGQVNEVAAVGLPRARWYSLMVVLVTSGGPAGRRARRGETTATNGVILGLPVLPLCIRLLLLLIVILPVLFWRHGGEDDKA